MTNMTESYGVYEGENKALHYSASKLGIDQIPEDILQLVGLVYSYGEHKYARDNWKSGTDWHEFYGSARRHMAAFWVGEDRDPESGCYHLAHAIWNLITLLYYYQHGLGKDDREIDGLQMQILRAELEAAIQRGKEAAEIQAKKRHQGMRDFIPSKPFPIISSTCGAYIYQDEVGPGSPRCTLPLFHDGFCVEEYRPADIPKPIHNSSCQCPDCRYKFG